MLWRLSRYVKHAEMQSKGFAPVFGAAQPRVFTPIVKPIPARYAHKLPLNRKLRRLSNGALTGCHAAVHLKYS